MSKDYHDHKNEMLLYINSLIDRRPIDAFNQSYWQTYLSKPIRTYGGKIKVRVCDIELPSTVYTIPYHSCVLWFEVNGNLNSFVFDINRVYSSSEIVSFLNGEMVAFGYNNIVFSYNDNTAKLTVTNNHALPFRIVGSYRYNDRVNDTYNNVCDTLGFTQNMIGLSITTGQSLQGQSVLRLLRSACYYLTCNLVNNGKILQSDTPTPYVNPSIICKIASNNWGKMSQINVFQINDVEFEVNESNIEFFQFEILDDELYPLNLNGSPVTFTLKITLD